MTLLIKGLGLILVLFSKVDGQKDYPPQCSQCKFYDDRCCQNRHDLQPDWMDRAANICPILIPGSDHIYVKPGNDLRLSCGAGTNCLTSCKWYLPTDYAMGIRATCEFDTDSGYGNICGDIQLVGDLDFGTCDILVKDVVQSRHNGTWKCETSTVDIYSDTVNITVSDHANGLALSTGAILGISIPLGVLLLLCIALLLTWCLCPAYLALICCCCCRNEKRRDHHQYDDDREFNYRSEQQQKQGRELRPLPSHPVATAIIDRNNPPNHIQQNAQRFDTQGEPQHYDSFNEEEVGGSSSGFQAFASHTSPPIQSYQYTGSNNRGNEKQMFRDITPSETMEQDVGYQFNTGIIPPNQHRSRNRDVSKIVSAATVTYAHVSPPPTRFQPKTARKISNTHSLQSFSQDNNLSKPVRNSKKTSVI